MRSRTENWGSSSHAGASRPAAAHTRARSPGPGIPRATSPQPQRSDFRSRSPGPGQMRARSPGPSMMQQQQQAQVTRNDSSPYPKFVPGRGQDRRGSGMEVQLSSPEGQGFYGDGPGRSRGQMMGSARPNSAYGGSYFQQQQPLPQQQGYDPHARMESHLKRERSKSLAAVGSRQDSGPGPSSGVLHYGMCALSLPTHGLVSGHGD